MDQDIVEQDKNGSELVVEFLYDENSRFAPGVLDRMLKCIFDTYHCSPKDLKITDAEANILVEKLDLIASHKELEIATMPFASR